MIMKRRAFALTLAFCLMFSWAQVRRPALTTAQEPPPTYDLFTPYIGGSACDEFRDSFDDPARGWFTGHQDGLLAQITGGEYQLQISGGGTIWMVPAPACAHSHYRAAVDAHWAGPSGNFYGLLFSRDETADRTYLFVVNTDARVWLVYVVDNGALDVVVDATHSAAILAGGAVNRLAAERQGDAISLTINDLPVGQLPGAAPDAPVIAGLVAASYVNQQWVEARFDDFEYLYRPPLP
jgi:hypothetical protein